MKKSLAKAEFCKSFKIETGVPFQGLIFGGTIVSPPCVRYGRTLLLVEKSLRVQLSKVKQLKPQLLLLLLHTLGCFPANVQDNLVGRFVNLSQEQGYYKHEFHTPSGGIREIVSLLLLLLSVLFIYCDQENLLVFGFKLNHNILNHWAQNHGPSNRG